MSTSGCGGGLGSCSGSGFGCGSGSGSGSGSLASSTSASVRISTKLSELVPGSVPLARVLSDGSLSAASGAPACSTERSAQT
ncbi:Protein of unknown function [Gryllus bimaculatus]|nr:Protein of unknown function [Gryllus bimaculatus]